MADNAEMDLYLKIREKEERLYSDDIVAQLPSFSKNHPLSNEWQARAKSALRLEKYLLRKSEYLKILDLGCGNGWLANLLCKAGYEVLGVDQNHYELKQAARVFFPNANLSFLETDIFSAPFLKESFDIILLASAVQYFSDFNLLIKNLFHYLKPDGEIHILDSAFYADNEISQAIRRSTAYYESLGFPEMSRHYFHHRISELEKNSAKWMYRPNSFILRLKRFFREIDSPFPWVVIKK